jgi:F420-dependent oxidoreductase-like protein
MHGDVENELAEPWLGPTTIKAMIKLGFTYGHYGGDGGEMFDSVLAQARAAEEAGFDSVWVADHLMQAPAVAPVEDPMLECYTTLGALAVATSRVRLGAFVGCPAYRSAALLGKIVSTLDVVSHGRAIFGIGAGWYEREHLAYGFEELGHHGERFERMVETIEIVRSMFVNDTTTYHGKHFRAEAALNSPKPVQSGGPPILIAGTGQKRTLRLVAEYADICNVLGSPEIVRHLMDTLDRHCEDVGRDPASICRTVTSMVIVRESEQEAEAAMPAVFRANPSPLRPVAGTQGQVVEMLRRLLEAGADGLILSCVQGDGTPQYIAKLAELAAAARDAVKGAARHVI